MEIAGGCSILIKDWIRIVEMASATLFSKRGETEKEGDDGELQREASVKTV